MPCDDTTSHCRPCLVKKAPTDNAKIIPGSLKSHIVTQTPSSNPPSGDTTYTIWVKHCAFEGQCDPKPPTLLGQKCTINYAYVMLHDTPESAIHDACTILRLKAKPPLYSVPFTPKTRCGKFINFEGGLAFTHDMGHQCPKHGDVMPRYMVKIYFTPKS